MTDPRPAPQPGLRNAAQIIDAAYTAVLQNGPLCDGVALINASHPRQPWYRRFIAWLRDPFGPSIDIDPATLQTLEIDISARHDANLEKFAMLNRTGSGAP